jgi:ferredoxin
VSDAADRLEALQRFYLRGRSGRAPQPVTDWAPRALAGLAPREALEAFPLTIASAAQGRSARAVPYAERVREAMAKVGGDTSMVSDHLDHLLLAAWQIVAGAGEPVAIGTLHAAASRAFSARLDLSEAGRRSLDAQLEAISCALDGSGGAIGFGPTVLGAAMDAALVARDARAATLVGELRALERELGRLLEADDAHGAESQAAPALAGALGGTTERFDVSAMAALLPRPRGTLRLDSARRERLTRARARLRAHVERFEQRPRCLWLDMTETAGLAPPASAAVSLHDEPLSAAARLVAEELAELEALSGAVREARSAADPDAAAVSDERTWHDLDVDELAVAPAIVAVVSESHIEGAGMGALSRLLRGGRPVCVVAVDTSAGLRLEEPGSLSLDLGLFGVAHREAYVARASAVAPSHLLDAAVGALASDRPALLCVGLPAPDASDSSAGASGEGGPASWLRLAAALRGRAFPVFRYDPALGTTWAERFSLDGNPDPDGPWGLAGGEAPMTWADAAAADPAFADHFWVDAPGLDGVGVSLDAFLAEPAAHEGAVPVLEGVDAAGRALTVALSRQLAVACWEHARAWRMLQELAGVHNAHVERALGAAESRHAAAQAELRAELAREHEEALARATAGATEHAMNTLAAALLSDGLFDPGGIRAGHGASPVAAGVGATLLAESAASASAAPSASGNGAAGAATSGAPAASTASPPADDDAGFADDPYIESYLCTTCNECLNAHPLVFAYNGDRQAVFKAPERATYAQLVDTAEKCPARCIHVGAPRPGDASATPEVLARAQAFH